MINSDILAYASVLELTRADIKSLKIKDSYGLHKVIYGLFEDVRSDIQKNSSESSGVLWANKGGDSSSKRILLLSNRKPHQTPQFGRVQTKAIMQSFVQYDNYGFEIIINPSKKNKNTAKIEAIMGVQQISSWAIERAKLSWGFTIHPDSLQVQINPIINFQKGGHNVTYNSVTLKGALSVTDREKFIHCFISGVGRGKAFGFGLLQIVPIVK
jgi:CRISPR system Cascade subunit CasE